MARYPIKMLKDEEGNPFVPLVSTEGVQSPDQRTLAELLGDKLEVDNIIPGENVTITTDGNDITISTSGKGVLIDDLNTATAGLGGLDAHQGKVLKEMIPNIIDDVTSTSTTEALSANQGYILNQKVVPAGGKAGQVLKKRSDSNHSLEWGDAADPNAIVGDGSIKKIIEITYEDYKILEDNGQVDPNTEYHILDAAQTIQNLQDILDGLQTQITTLKNSLKPVATSGKYTDLDGEPSVVNNLTSTSTTDALSAAQGKILGDRLNTGLRLLAKGSYTEVHTITASSFNSIPFDTITIYDSSSASNSGNQIKITNSGVYIVIYYVRWKDATSASVNTGITINNSAIDTVQTSTWDTQTNRYTGIGFKILELEPNTLLQGMFWGDNNVNTNTGDYLVFKVGL